MPPNEAKSRCYHDFSFFFFLLSGLLLFLSCPEGIVINFPFFLVCLLETVLVISSDYIFSHIYTFHLTRKLRS